MAPNPSRQHNNRNQSRGRFDSPQVARQGHKPRGGSNHAANLSFQNKTDFRTSTPQNPPTASLKDMGMSPASRYSQNLRVLRRHDPSITSIFDQFSHVCLYHYDGARWLKQGYEGSMFLFEREQEPKYGFFILNRMGTEDYIRYLVPSDFMSAEGTLLHFKTLTKNPERPGHDVEEIVGLWIMDTNVREPMSAVMMRLLSYVQKGEPYPLEYRYGPDRSAPMQITASKGEDEELDNDQTRQRKQSKKSAPASEPQVGMSELDVLFAKLGPASQLPQSEPDEPAPESLPANVILDYLNSGEKNGKEGTTDSLTMSALRKAEVTIDRHLPSTSGTENMTLTGKALLDSMFASVPADPASSGPVASQQQTPMASFRFPQHLDSASIARSQDSRHMFMDPEILSPKPSAAALPQILSASALHNLMGIPSDSSRSPSRTSTSTSSQAQSSHGTRAKNGYNFSPSSSGAHRSRERGYIADRGEDDGGISEASTGIESDGQAGVIYGPPLNRAVAPHTLVSRPSFLSVTSSGATNTGNMKGDATPRARSERLDSSLTSPPQTFQNAPRTQRPATGSQALSEQSITTVVENSLRKPPKSLQQQREPAPAQTPFRSGSDFWPHEEPSTANSSQRQIEVETEQDTDDVVELDFSEISVLNDMKALEARANGGSSAQHGKDRQASKAVKGKLATSGSTPKVNGKAAHQENAGQGSSEGDRRSRNKDARKVEVLNGLNTAKPNGSAATSSTPSSSISTQASPSAPSTESKFPAIISPQLAEGVLMREMMRPDLHLQDGPALDKHSFIREILTLIHTNKGFSDNLYESYLSQRSHKL